MPTGAPIGKWRLQGHVPKPWLAPKALPKPPMGERPTTLGGYVRAVREGDRRQSVKPPCAGHGGAAHGLWPQSVPGCVASRRRAVAVNFHGDVGEPRQQRRHAKGEPDAVRVGLWPAGQQPGAALP